MALAILSLWAVSTSAFADGCKFGKIVEFPVTMEGMRPLVTASVNGVDVQFLVDSGAFYSLISDASAAELKTSAIFGSASLIGAHGRADVSIATAKTFTLAGVSLHNVEFLVGGSEAGAGSVGMLGQNILHIGDVEYDLGQGMVRLMKAEDCRKAFLAYWVGNSTPYSVINLVSEPELTADTTSSRIAPKPMQVSRTLSSAYVNGMEISVMFDTGAATSILSVKAAQRAGVKIDSQGVVSAGPSHGIGKIMFDTYIAPFSSFKIGEEEIKNTRLRIGDIDVPNADMLIGADFFLSHRIYVANSQHKLYFTYNGGPVFNLKASGYPVGEPATVASAQQAIKEGATVEDAADYGRRGAALAARREFDQALAALTRACELAPENSEYFYQRGMVHWQLNQRTPAMADFDQALKLTPKYLKALMARAELLQQRGEKELAAADLDAADAIAPKEADERYEMADAYTRSDRLAAAIAQYTLWIDAHADDARLPVVQSKRCWFRALAGTDLSMAIKECSALLKSAAKSSPYYAQVANSRGLIYLRTGEYDKSIADYDASLKIDAKNAWALYGRGIDRLRTQKTSDGNADIEKATAVLPEIAEQFKRRGVVP